MTDIQHFRTPAIEIEHDDKSRHLVISGRINASGERQIFLDQELCLDGTSVPLSSPRRDPAQKTPFDYGAVFKEHGEELMSWFYADDEISRAQEIDLLDDWWSMPLHMAHDRWIAREDGRRHGFIRPGDFAVCMSPVDKVGNILLWDQSSWRNMICFLDPREEFPGNAGKITMKQHAPRRLSSESMREAIVLNGGHLASSNGSWSAHELLQILSANTDASKTEEIDDAYGF